MAYDKKPRCLVCDRCDKDKTGKKHICRTTGTDVTKEHFALCCPNDCPLK